MYNEEVLSHDGSFRVRVESSCIVSSEHQEPPPEKRQPTSELWGPWFVPGGESNRPDNDIISGTQFKKPIEPLPPVPAPDNANNNIDPQAIFREHVTHSSPSYPASSAPGFQPSLYNPYNPSTYPASSSGYPPRQHFPPPGVGYPPAGAGYPNFAVPSPSFQGYVSGPPSYPPYSAFPGYPYPYPYPPPQPKRDGYLLAVGIAAFVGSILALLGGLLALLVLAFAVALPANRISDSQRFTGAVLYLVFALIGVIGGSFGLYHSIRSVFLRKPSKGFSTPTFWLFVAFYVIVIGVGFALHSQGLAQSNLPLMAALILLAGLFPALAVLALGNRRLRFPKGAAWPTSWRRFTFAIVSGGTLGIGVALLLELILSAVLVRGQGVDPIQCLNNPNATACQNPNTYSLLLIIAAVIAPLVEETVKPLAVIVLIGRVRSAAEAFVLGLACGIGFDLIETSGYISSSNSDWLNIALERTGAGLLHGLGAAMVALGWYYLTHPGKNRVPKAVGCWLYAFAQHALWNGSFFLALLPGSVGTFFANQSLTIGSFSLPYFELINVGEAVFILFFFLYMTRRLREKPAPISLS